MTIPDNTQVRERSLLYTWLAAAFHIPDEEIASADFARVGRELQTTLLPRLQTDAPSMLDALGDADRTTGDHTSRLSRLEDLKREYARLFLGPPRALIHPYESCYFGEDRLMTARTVAVGAFFQECGVIPDPAGVREPVDHIAVELEFLAIVCAGELPAHNGNTGDPGDPSAPACAEIEHRFLREHLGQWGLLLAYDIRAATAEPLYEAAAMVLEAVLKESME